MFISEEEKTQGDPEIFSDQDLGFDFKKENADQKFQFQLKNDDEPFTYSDEFNREAAQEVITPLSQKQANKNLFDSSIPLSPVGENLNENLES